MEANHIRMTLAGVLTIAVLGGCSAGYHETPVMTDAAAFATVPGPGMKKTSDLMIQYRRQARDLREMARQLETESALYAQRQDQEGASEKQQLAQEARTAADRADEQARLYQRQIPHGQVY